MFLFAGACLSAMAAAGVWVMLRLAGDRWWFATVILFGPRWVLLAPYTILIPATLIFRQRSFFVALIGLGITLFPVMDFCIPWSRLAMVNPSRPHIRVLTCNTHSLELDVLALRELIHAQCPDLVTLQSFDSDNRAKVFDQGEWFFQVTGDLCVASRFPIRQHGQVIPSKLYGIETAVGYDVEFPFQSVSLVNVHLQSPHVALLAVLRKQDNGPGKLQSNSTLRMQQLQLLSQFAAAHGPATLMLGDFNTPSDSPSFLRELSTWKDAFSSAGWGCGYTYFEGGTSARIDHILEGPRWRCGKCWAAPSVGSPHRPLIADLEWSEPPEAR